MHVAAIFLPVRKVLNKMTDNNGTVLPHETDFDISKDRFLFLV